jgi:hypothetical protein
LTLLKLPIKTSSPLSTAAFLGQRAAFGGTDQVVYFVDLVARTIKGRADGGEPMCDKRKKKALVMNFVSNSKGS